MAKRKWLTKVVKGRSLQCTQIGRRWYTRPAYGFSSIAEARKRFPGRGNKFVKTPKGNVTVYVPVMPDY